jgi:Concanavalin A-like lectin/glucanases superfamily/GDSL-like Lipase/Acylhydrolase family
LIALPKSFVPAIAALALAVPVVTAQMLPAAAVSPAGLQVHLPFDGTLLDASGNGNDAVLLGGASLHPLGQAGSAVAVGGDDDMVRLTDADAVTGLRTTHSVSLWFRADATSGRQVIYEQGGATRGLAIYVLGGQVHVGGWNTPTSESGWAGSWLSGPVTAGTWHHVALTLNGGPTLAAGAFRAYLDGAPLGSAAGSQLYAGGTFGLGGNDGFVRFHDIGAVSAKHGLTGRIDDVRVYQRVLSSAEVAELARGATPPANQPPSVSVAGSAVVSASQAAAVPISGTVADDGLPSGASLTLAWTVRATPSGGSTIVAQPGAATTTVALAGLGNHVLRLTANDGQLLAFAELTITVVADDPPGSGDTVRIMPVGDSITEAKDGPDKRGMPSWRKWFWDLAQDDGRDTDLVGSRSGVLDGDNPPNEAAPPASWGVWDIDHDGHYGWRADEILSGNASQPSAGDIVDWSRDHQPDVYLIHIGTNDLAGGQSAAGAAADVGAIIDAIRTVRPQAKIAVSQLIDARFKTSQPTLRADIDAFNALMPGVAQAKSTAQSPVIVVDHHTGWNASVDNYDTLHPSVAGQQKMAVRYYDAIEAAGWLGTGGGGGGGVSVAGQILDLGFDGSFADSSGQGNTAVAVGAVTLDPAGHSGGAARFPGGTARLGLTNPNAVATTVGDRTISLWFRADAVAARQVLYEQGGTTRGLVIYVQNGSVVVGGWNTPAAESGWAGSFLSAPVTAGAWHHVVLRLDGGITVTAGALAGWLDGVAIGTAPGSQLWSHASVGIGGNDGGVRFQGATSTSPSPLVGRIDRLRIWNRVLAPVEIAALAAGSA